MKTASISKTKNGLSSILDLVKGGETVVITEHRRPIAQIAPLSFPDAKSRGWLQGLVADGLVHPSKKPLDIKKFLAMKRPRTQLGASLQEALLEERKKGF